MTPAIDVALAHKHFSADCFNRAWGLIENEGRTAEDNAQMVLLALASLWHWTQRSDCTDRNLSIGHWLVARVYALVGDGAQARRHAESCLTLAKGSPAFYVAYAHEALARAALVLGDSAAARRHLSEARTLAESVTAGEERKSLEKDLASLASGVT